jgi:predicted permease
MVKRLFALFRNLFHRSVVDRELNEELDATVDILTEERMRQGVPRGEARRQALIEIGGVEQVKENVWSMKAGRLLLDLWRDLRFGVRLLRKHPGFSAAAILTLALGIGANTAIFSAVNGIFLQSLPYHDSSRLIVIDRPITIAQFREILQECPALQQIATYDPTSVRLTAGMTPKRTWAVQVSSNFFSVLATNPLLGRHFTPGDMQPGNERVAILSYDLWMDLFGGDTDVIGRSVSISRTPYTIVGVMPREFGLGLRGAYLNQLNRIQGEIWLPQISTPQYPPNHEFGSQAIARLNKNTALAQVNAQLQPLSARFAKTSRRGLQGTPLRARNLDIRFEPQVQTGILILAGAVGFVLLLACVNVTSLLVARSWTRQRELAIRKSLGASRLRILRQFLAESLLLALAGGALGLLLSTWGIRILRLLAPPNTPRVDLIQLNGRALCFTMGLSLLVAFMVGLAPAFQATSRRIAVSLKESLSSSLAGATIRKRHYLGSALVVAEVLLATILTVGGALMARSYCNLMGEDTGVSTEHAVTMRVEFSDLVCTFRDDTDYEAQEQKCRLAGHEALDRIQQIPGVERAAMSLGGPFYGGVLFRQSEEIGIFVDNLRENKLRAGEWVNPRPVTQEYFAALGIRLLKGRGFKPGDTRAVIINESFARKYISGNPLGKRFSIDRNRPSWMEIIGVVNDTRDRSVSQEAFKLTQAAYYEPLQGIGSSGIAVNVQTSTNPLPLVTAITHAVKSVDKDALITDIKTLDQILSESAADSKFQTALLGSFGALALILAIVGIYGVISYSVVQQTHEIGVRMALGAQRGRILRMILRRGMLLAIAGTIIGIAGALALTRVLRTMLYEIKPNDPGTFTGVGLLLIFAALAACYIPARQAAKSDPITALRNE